MTMTVTKNADDVLRHINVIERLAIDVTEVAVQVWKDKQLPAVMAAIRTMNADPEQYIGLNRTEIMERLITAAFPTENTALIVGAIKQKYGI